jgi:hypothetical protein
MNSVKPRTADDLTPAELAAAAIDMERVLEREPLLSDNGFKQLRGRRSQAEHEAQFIRWGEDMREPRSLAQFTAARGWLGQFSKTKALNRRGTSYGLKHCAADDIGYTTNGTFIGAAIAEGFTVRCVEFGSPNAWFNISTGAWRHTERGREERRRLARMELRERQSKAALVTLDELAQLWAEDRSVSAISAVLNTTKGKVIGAVWRARKAGDLRFAPRPPRPKAAPKPRRPKPVDEAVGTVRPPPAPKPIPFAGLASGMCRYPINAPARGGEFLFCGAPTARPGANYCSHHAEIAIRVSPSSALSSSSRARIPPPVFAG